MVLLEINLRSESTTLQLCAQQTALVMAYQCQHNKAFFTKIGHFVRDEESAFKLIFEMFIRSGNAQLDYSKAQISTLMKTVYQTI